MFSLLFSFGPFPCCFPHVSFYIYLIQHYIDLFILILKFKFNFKLHLYSSPITHQFDTQRHTAALYAFYYIFAFDDIFRFVCFFCLFLWRDLAPQTPQTASSSKLPYILCTSLCHNWMLYCIGGNTVPAHHSLEAWAKSAITSARIGMYILKIHLMYLFFFCSLNVLPCIYL